MFKKVVMAMVLVLVLVMSTMAFAGQATINFNGPTTYVDLTPIAAVDLPKIIYTAYYGTVSGTYPNKVVLGTGVSSGVITNLTAGTTYYFVVTATLNALESANSNGVSRLIPFVATGSVTITSVTSP